MKILVVGLQKQAQIMSATFELISAARQIGEDLTTVVLAADAAAVAEPLTSRGGGQVVAVSNPALELFNDEN